MTSVVERLRVRDEHEAADLIDSLTVQLSQARAAAFEEAAKVAEAMPNKILHVYARGPNDPPGNQWVQIAGQHMIAAAIRARAREGE